MIKTLLQIIVFFLICALVASSGMAQISGEFTNGGAVRFGSSTTTCDAAAEGAVRWHGTAKTLETCSGAAWKQAVRAEGSGTGFSPEAGTGYFVVTDGEWDGNMGGLAGANTLCLNDLNANNWIGKTDATTRGILIAGKVRAFLCSDASCQLGTANTKYYFAVSGEAASGGAEFTTDASGFGSGNTQRWTGQNYFNGGKEYWTGNAGNTSLLWGSSVGGTGTVQRCGGFTSSSAAHTGAVGAANHTDGNRWRMNPVSAVTCDTLKRIICFVHP